jgi:hypothetical protein
VFLLLIPIPDYGQGIDVKMTMMPSSAGANAQDAFGFAQGVRLLLPFRVAWLSFWSLGRLRFMSIFHDKSIARRMLQARQHGYTFGHFIRINAKRFLLLYAIFFLLIYLSTCIHNYAAFYAMIGMTIGVLARDFAWFRSNRAVWSFTEKTTDWQRVENLAKDEPSA